jgi:hypothetical protein
MTRAPSARELIELRFALDVRGRLLGTNEPPPRGRAPRLAMIRTAEQCAWAVRADVDDTLAERIAALAAGEPPMRDLRDEPAQRSDYGALLRGAIDTGPTFLFPEASPQRSPRASIALAHKLELVPHANELNVFDVA